MNREKEWTNSTQTGKNHNNINNKITRISRYPPIIILKVDGLNSLIKNCRLVDWIKKKTRSYDLLSA
jgi:hypothetical protein